MSRRERIVLVITLLLMGGVVVFRALAPTPFEWQRTYYAHSRQPFGCALVRERLPDLFPQGVTTVREPIYVTAENGPAPGDRDPVVHMFVDNSFGADHLDVRRLLDLVKEGDDAFIAAEDMGDLLLDTLHIRMGYHWMPMDSVMRHARGRQRPDSSSLRFTCRPLAAQGTFPFARSIFYHTFDRFPLDSTQVLAVNDDDRPVLVRMSWGAGHITLCSTPEAFTNYYLLKPEASGFLLGTCSLLPDRPVLWDEFYKVGRAESSTPLRYILAQPALKAAYWCVLALLVLYIFVYAKRRQRAIPQLEPLKNTSRDFAETIGRLYFAQGDHADLARKMVLFFKDEVRQRLYLRRAVWDEETLRHVSERTSIPVEEWRSAFKLMAHYEKEPYVGQEQLLKLNKVLSSLRARL